jgi:hypothetical protein
MKDAVAARIAMGREGRQAEYDIYPGLTDPWESRRFGVGEALYASLGIRARTRPDVSLNSWTITKGSAHR